MKRKKGFFRSRKGPKFGRIEDSASLFLDTLYNTRLEYEQYQQHELYKLLMGESERIEKVVKGERIDEDCSEKIIVSEIIEPKPLPAPD